MDSSGNICILSMDINDDIAFITVKTNIITGETYFLADSPGNLLEVNLVFVNTNFSKKNNLKCGNLDQYIFEKRINLPFRF